VIRLGGSREPERLTMKIGIQVLNYNGMRWLPGVLGSLAQHCTGDHVVYVVDNASTDDSVDYIRADHPGVRIVALDRNMGYGGAYTRAMPLAFADGCDWVCLQNSDTLVTPGWLEPLRAAAVADPQIGIMGPVFWGWDAEEPNYYMEGRCADLIPFMDDPTAAPVDRDWIEGSSFFIRRECHASLGGFDPLYFMYWEDAEYCRRAHLHGWRVVIVPGAICRHYARGSTQEAGRSVDLFRSHLLYTLSDPSHGPLRNTAAAMRLAATYVKQTVWHEPSFAELTRLLTAAGSAAMRTGRCFRSRAEVLSQLRQTARACA
jgi:GT2 family glycosyltransferase